MNTKRLLIAIAVAFVYIFASDFLIHGVWLGAVYQATAALWRPEAEMNARMPWMLAGQLLCAVTFVLLWARGFADRRGLKGACLYGLLMGLFAQVGSLMNFAVMPLPGGLVAKWFVSGLGQAVGLAVVTFYVSGPTPGGGREQRAG